jgi:hypothetical protein
VTSALEISHCHKARVHHVPETSIRDLLLWNGCLFTLLLTACAVWPAEEGQTQTAHSRWSSPSMLTILLNTIGAAAESGSRSRPQCPLDFPCNDPCCETEGTYERSNDSRPVVLEREMQCRG